MASASPAILLAADTARELMTPNPLFIVDGASVAEAARLLNTKGIGAVPAVNGTGKLVGVLSRADIVRHACECLDRSKLAVRDVPIVAWERALHEAFDALPIKDGLGATPVRMVMTPVVCTVSPDTPALRVIEELLKRNVHRLFVVREENLVGVITTGDVLRELRCSESESQERPELKRNSGRPAIPEQLRQAHSKLLSELRKLQKATRQASRITHDELVSHLRATRALVQQHFRLEEANGYLENVQNRQPQADHAIQRLWTEHRELLNSLDALIAEASAAAPREPLAAKIKAWVARVRAHESHENALVQDAFNLDISAED
jgi:CBS domain-containing protein